MGIVYNIHEKFLNSDWLRAVQGFRNTVPKNETQCKFLNFFEIFFLIFYFSNFLILLISNVTYVCDCIIFSCIL
jgi:hypothetical protein